MAGSEIGRRIAAARREVGLTQRELAERIGVMVGFLDAYENGMVVPFRLLDRIAAATGKETSWFLRGIPPEEMADPELTEQTLQGREAELELARRKLREASEELAHRTAALETRERELEASRQRHAEESERLRSQQATLGPREQALTQREQELKRRQTEIANRTQTAHTDLLKEAKAVDDRRGIIEREQLGLEEARAEAQHRLVGLLELVRTAAAQLEAQLAERQPEEEAKPSRWRRGRRARARSVPQEDSVATQEDSVAR